MHDAPVQSSSRLLDTPIRYYRAAGLAEARHGGHVVLLDAACSRYYGLDQVGARIWELLRDRPMTAEEIVAHIAEEYEAPLDEIGADVQSFVDQLLKARLISLEAAR